MSAWPPSLVNQSVHPAKCRANCFWDKNAEKCVTRGLRGEGGGGYAFPFTSLVLYLRLLRWSGCFMPKMKCLSALVLVTGRASLFVEVKNLFFDQVTRYPALNRLKAVASTAVRRLISATHLQKL